MVTKFIAGHLLNASGERGRGPCFARSAARSGALYQAAIGA